MPTSRTRKKHLQEFAAVVAEIRQEAKEKGLDKMTMREINAIVTEVRREKDPLYGQVHRVSLTLSERIYRHTKAAAEAEGGSFSDYVRQALAERLDKNISKQPSPKTTKAIAESTEKFKSGRYEP
jgi:DNA repair exonuclease SbcCD ATPase subunit